MKISDTEQDLIDAETQELLNILRNAATTVIDEIGMGRAVELAAQIIEVTSEECATGPIVSHGVWRSLDY